MGNLDYLLVEERARNWEDAITICANTLCRNHVVRETFLQACIDREKIFPTGFPVEPGVAIPHTDSIHVIRQGICVLRLIDPVEFHRIDAPDCVVNVKLVFNLALIDSDKLLGVLQRLMAMFQKEDLLIRLCNVERDEMFSILQSTLCGEVM
jgi:PTS system galactitol-specific IIA component